MNSDTTCLMFVNASGSTLSVIVEGKEITTQ